MADLGMTGEARVAAEEMMALRLQQTAMEERAMNAELGMAKNFESVRKQWLHAETELKKYKELLVKSDVAKAALEVQLKHARNQLDVEMRKRCKAEGRFQYLQRQMELLSDFLLRDGKSAASLSEEQKSFLATWEKKGANKSSHRSSQQLSAVDESSFLWHSEISYDRTDDDTDPDAAALKPLRSRAREMRRSSMGVTLSADPGPSGDRSAESPELKTQETGNSVRTSVGSPGAGGPPAEAAGVAQDGPEEPRVEFAVLDAGGARFPGGPERARAETERCKKHDFVSKTVIRPETCSPCGKRIRFGKMALKCRGCGAVSHPECKQRWSETCAPAAAQTLGGGRRHHVSARQASLEALAPSGRPRIPALVVECVKEIERRGLRERGLYGVAGGERQVKEVLDGLAAGRTPARLRDVSDIHVLCGVLKDFLRKLEEPLVTFKLRRNFVAASEMSNEGKRSAAMFRAIAELPEPNRDTLAFLVLHLHGVMRSPRCQMDQNTLARVFGPALVGQGLSETSTPTALPKVSGAPARLPCRPPVLQVCPSGRRVVCHFLSLPEDYWRRLLSAPAPPSQKRGNRGMRVGSPRAALNCSAAVWRVAQAKYLRFLAVFRMSAVGSFLFCLLRRRTTAKDPLGAWPSKRK